MEELINIFKYDPNRTWCEPDYIYHPYIAEYWNTLSNISLLCLSLYGIYWHFKLHCRIQKYYIVCIFIALGSAWYHATISRIGQLADEIPMLILTYMLCYNYIRWNKLYYVTIIIILLYVILDIYILFFLYFSTIIIIVLYYSNSIIKNRVQIKLHNKAIYSFCIGFLAWLIDTNFCNHYIENLHLHSLWHICSGFSLYWYIQFMMAYNGKLYYIYPLEVIKISYDNENNYLF